MPDRDQSWHQSGANPGHYNIIFQNKNILKYDLKRICLLVEANRSQLGPNLTALRQQVYQNDRRTAENDGLTMENGYHNGRKNNPNIRFLT